MDIPRLFTPFLDTTDMVMCCAADASLGSTKQGIEKHGLRFPLVCDLSFSLRQHLAAVEYTSQSARFGPYADNILGMNWALQSGLVVRIGERVIKSTTGYDLLRFLLHSDGRYGQAVHYVLRLRPSGGEAPRAVLCGSDTAIEKARSFLLRSPWIHWLDSVDLVIATDNTLSLELATDCGKNESPIFEDFYREICRRSGAELAPSNTSSPEVAGLPALTIKTTSSPATTLARQLVSEFGGSARVLCVNGVVQYFPTPGMNEFPEATRQVLDQRAAAEGGHLFGAWAKTPSTGAKEKIWADSLESAWNKL